MGVCSSCSQNCKHDTSNIQISDLCFSPENIHSFFCEYNRKTIPKPPNAKWEPQLFTILCDKLFSGQNNNIDKLFDETICSQLSPFCNQVDFFSNRFTYIVDKLRNKLHNEPIELEKSWQRTSQSLSFDRSATCEVPFILGATFSVFFELLPEIDKSNEKEFDEILSNILDALISTQNVTKMDNFISPQLFFKLNSSLVSIATQNIFTSLSVRTKIIAFLLRIAEIEGDVTTIISSINIALEIPSDSFSNSLYMPNFKVFPELPINDFNHWNKKWSLEPIKNIISMTASENFIYIAAKDDEKKNSLYSLEIVTGKIEKINIEIPKSCILTIDDMSLYVCNTDKNTIETYSIQNYSHIKTIILHPSKANKEYKIVSICFFNTEIYVLRDEGGAGNYIIESYIKDETIKINLQIPNTENEQIPENNNENEETDKLDDNGLYLYDFFMSCEEDSEDEQTDINFKVNNSSCISTPFMDCTFITNGCYIALISPTSPTMLSFAFEEDILVVKHIPSIALCKPGSFITAFSKFAYVIEDDSVLKRFDDTFGVALTFERKETDNISNDKRIGSFIESIISMLLNQLIALIPNVINNNFQDVDKRVKRAIKFFVSQNTEETILSAIDLGTKCLDDNSTYSKSVRELIIIFTLQVIACSLRFYTFRFPYDNISIHDDQIIDTSGKIVFAKIRSFIDTVTNHPLIHNSRIVCAAFQVINAGFKYLYNPYYTEFTDLVNKLSSQESKEESVAAAIPFLLGSNALFYCINDETVKILTKYHPPSIVARILSDQIPLINNEHFFISGHKYKVEHVIATFVSASFKYFSNLICMEDISTRKQDSIEKILQIIARILSMNKKSCIILGTFGTLCLNLLKEFMPKFKLSDLAINHDKVLSMPLDSATKINYKYKVFETTHPYPPKQDKETPFEMCGASEIKIEFDPKCATEATTDYLQIFDKAEGGSSAYKTLTGPSGPGWPSKISIQSDTCRFLFHSEESTSEWGIKCTISANVPVTKSFIDPNINLTIINLLCFSLGWSIQNIIESIEEQGVDQEKIITEENSSSRQISKEEEDFLKSVADTENIHPLVKAIKGKMRIPRSMLQDNELDCIAIASIIRQSNLIKDAMEFSKTNQLSPKLFSVARYLPPLKTKLKQENASLLPGQLRENVIKKAEYFTFHEDLNMQVNDFIHLLKSEMPLAYFFQQRKEKSARKFSVSNVPTMIKDFFCLENIPHTGKIAFISQLKKAGKIAAESNEIFSLLLKMLIDDTPNSLQLFILSLMKDHSGFDYQQYKEILKFLTNYKANSVEEHVFEESIWIYLLKTVITNNNKAETFDLIKTCLLEDVPLLKKKGLNTETTEYKLSMILALLIDNKLTIDIKNLLENYVIDTPRHFNAIVRLAACTLAHNYNSFPQEFRFIGADFTINTFITEMFDFIALPITQEKIKFKNHGKTQLSNGKELFEKFPLSSHQLISSELILCIRYMMNIACKSSESIKKVINEVIQDALEKNQISEQLLSTFIILGGGMHPHANGCYSMTHDGKLFSISETNPLSNEVYGFIVDTLEFTNFTKSSLTSCSILPIPKYDFTKYVNKFYDIHKLFISKSTDSFTCMEASVFSSFYTLLPIILQNRDLSIAFENNTEFLVSLLNFANSATQSDKFDTLPDIISTLNYFMYIENSNKQIKDQTEPVEPIVESHIINEKNDNILTGIKCAYGTGVIKGREFYSTMQSLFVANRTLNGNSPFYFEVKVLKHLKPDEQISKKDDNNVENISFRIGFADTSSPTRFYQLTVPRYEVSSPTGNVKACGIEQVIHSGDVLGVEYNRSRIAFFLNGKRLSQTIDFPPFGDYIPFVLDQTGNGHFSINFGQEPFTEDPNYNPFLIFRQKENENNEEQRTGFMLKTPSEYNFPQISINSLVFVKRIRINPNEAYKNEEINIPDESRCMLNRIGTVKDISATKSKINVKVSFYDTTTGEEEIRDINLRFVHIMPEYRFDITKNTEEGQYYTQKLSIRASRYALMALVYNSPMLITKLCGLTKPEKVSNFFSLLNIELKEFSPVISIKPDVVTTSEMIQMETLCTSKLHELLCKTQYLIFTQTDQFWFFFEMMKNAIFNISPDLQLIDKVQIPSSENKNQQLQSAALTEESQKDSHNVLFEEAKLTHRVVSPDRANSFFLDYTINESDAVGFVVPIHSDNNVPKGVITVNGIDLVSLSKYVRFIPGNSIYVKGVGNMTQGRKVKFAFLPISKYMTDQHVSTPIGAFHILTTVLSLYFSFLESHPSSNARKYLKDILPLAIKLMMSRGIVSRLVAFEIIAPILTKLEWCENDEILFGASNDITHYMKSFNNIISDKELLNPPAEQAVLLSVMIDLNRLHSAEKAAIRDKSKIKGYLTMLHEMNSRESKTNFEKIADSFLKVTALAHNWNFQISFPSFLLIEDFMMKIPHKTLNLSPSKFKQEGEKMTYQYKSDEWESIQIDFENISDVQVGAVAAKNHGIYKFSNAKITVPSVTDDFLISITPKSFQFKKQLLFFEEHFDEFLKLCQEMKDKWTAKMDEELLHALRSHNNEKLADELTDTEIIKSNVLRKIDSESLRIRIKLVKNINSVMSFLVKKVDIKSQNSLLASGIFSARAAIATCHKQNIFKERVNYNLRDNSRIHLRFNRSRAILHMDRPDHPSAATLIRQLIEQVPLKLIDSLKRDSVPWHVDLIGEGATDAGGPSRDIFTQMCQEIVHPSTGMFICSPNTKFMTGDNAENVDKYIPNPYCQDLTMFEYAGVLMTIAYVSRMPQPFRFAEFVWRFLTGHSLTIEDIYSTDSGFEAFIKAFEESGASLVNSGREYVFTVVDASGKTKELIPNGSQRRVTEDNLSEYLRLAKEYRINEMLAPLEYLRRGIYHFFPQDAVALLSSWELELFVSGDTNVSVEELKKCCKFDPRDPSSAMLWKVIESFTPTERMLFIKFATGRMGLPSPGMTWHSPLTITWSGLQGRSDETAELPTAQTCSSTIRIPRYTTEEAMARKIRTAFLYSGEIVNDRNQNAADIVQLS